MTDIEFSTHAKDMLIERKIQKKWISRTINQADKKYMGDDDNMHYIKAIKEMEDRVLHVVVNLNVYPHRIITLFFDRRLGSKYETEN